MLIRYKTKCDETRKSSKLTFVSVDTEYETDSAHTNDS